MLEAYPFILDALLEGTDEEVERFSTVVQWMARSLKKHGSGGQFSNLVVDIDRSPLAVYLCEQADSTSRAMILSMMNEVWRDFCDYNNWCNRLLRQRDGTQGFLGRFSPVVFIKL